MQCVLLTFRCTYIATSVRDVVYGYICIRLPVETLANGLGRGQYATLVDPSGSHSVPLESSQGCDECPITGNSQETLVYARANTGPTVTNGYDYSVRGVIQK